MVAMLTCRVRSFCSLLEGRPFCIMYIFPWGAGYCGSSTHGTVCTTPVMLSPAVGCGGGGGTIRASALAA